MADGKRCPACGRDVGLWAVFKAGLPDRIWCPHCGTRVGYERIGGPLAVLLVAMAALVPAAWYAAGYEPAAFAVTVLAAWCVVEWAAVLFLRSNRRLVRHGVEG
jgi:DNA-directed RNA polymerase subunit RPC12/RpoP